MAGKNIQKQDKSGGKLGKWQKRKSAKKTVMTWIFNGQREAKKEKVNKFYVQCRRLYDFYSKSFN